MLKESPDFARAQEILRCLGQLCDGDAETVARIFHGVFNQDIVRRPGTRRVLRHFRAIFGLLVGTMQEDRAEVDEIRALSDDELERATFSYVLKNAPELFVEEI